MKTFLYGTTAMIAAAAVAGDASAQAAKKPNEKITLQLGGYFQANYVFGDESRGQKACPIINAATGVSAGCLDSAAPSGTGGIVPFGGNVNEPGRARRFQRVNREGEVYFRGQTTLDNGLTVGAYVQLEAETCADQIDESYIYFSGSFGRVEFGSMDTVAEQMWYAAPAAIPGHSTNVFNMKQYQSGNNLTTTVNVGPRLTGYGESEGINYYTPRIAGFQFGLSYIPDNCQENAGAAVACGGSYGGFTPANTVGQQSDIVVLGANFVRKFGPVDTAIAFFWAKGHNEGTTGNGTAVATTDAKDWGVGAQFGYMGFTLGGGWGRTNRGLRSNNSDREDYSIGLSYKTGPWQFGIEYGHTEIGAGIAGAGVQAAINTRAGTDEQEILNAGVIYTMGPGIQFYGGIQYFNVDDNFSNPAAENDGVVVILGTFLAF